MQLNIQSYTKTYGSIYKNIQKHTRKYTIIYENIHISIQ